MVMYWTGYSGSFSIVRSYVRQIKSARFSNNYMVIFQYNIFTACIIFYLYDSESGVFSAININTIQKQLLCQIVKIVQQLWKDLANFLYFGQ